MNSWREIARERVSESERESESEPEYLEKFALNKKKLKQPTSETRADLSHFLAQLKQTGKNDYSAMKGKQKRDLGELKSETRADLSHNWAIVAEYLIQAHHLHGQTDTDTYRLMPDAKADRGTQTQTQTQT